MSTKPKPGYPNSERLARLMRAFDNTVTGKYQANVTVHSTTKITEQHYIAPIPEAGRKGMLKLEERLKELAAKVTVEK